MSEHTEWVRREAARRGVDLTPERLSVLDVLKQTAPIWLPILLGVILFVALFKL